MKKLSLSILLLMTSLSVFSQNVTKDSSAIQLRKPIARLVIKDLIKGDGAQLELNNLQQTLTATEQKVALKDSIIVTQTSKIVNLNEIIFKKDVNGKYYVENSDEIMTKAEQYLVNGDSLLIYFEGTRNDTPRTLKKITNC